MKSLSWLKIIIAIITSESLPDMQFIKWTDLSTISTK